MRAIKFALAYVALVTTTAQVQAGIISIGGMTNPSVTIDFGTFSTGPTSVAAINGAFPTAGISSIVFSESPGSGVYDTDLGSGNALAADGSGGLIIVPEGGTYGNADLLTITLDHYATQFGFQLADRAESTLNLYDGLSLVGTITTPNILTPPVTDFFESSVAFNRIEISQAVNWVIPELVIETRATAVVPEPSSFALFGIGACVMAVRRRRRSESY